jgi:hypothetical protein
VTLVTDVSGPLFHSEAQLDGMLHEIESAVAQRGYELVQANLAGSLQHPRGGYQSTINVRHDGPGAEVTDNGTKVYNHWLEGTGSRNAPATRFTGYHSFRRASEELDAQAEDIAEPIVAQFCAAVN